MAESDEQAVAERPAGRLRRLREWASGNKRRSTLIGVGFVIASVATIASWLTVAEIASDVEEVTVPRALAALDEGEDEVAKSIIAQLRDDDQLSAADYGGAFYVLGALKVREAERQWSADRSRADYFVASQYLAESRALGFHGGREAEGLFLLGKSLIESRQLEPGIEVLRQALDAGARGESRAHLLLAEAHFYAPTPDYEQTIVEVDAALSDPRQLATDRSKALLLKAEALSLLGRGNEALRCAEEAGDNADPARRALAEGKALVTQLVAAAPTERRRLAAEAEAALERARYADQLSTSVTRESDYLKARVAELTGDRAKALAAYSELRRSNGSSPSGVAAAIAEGELRQSDGADTEALEAYRRALESIEDPKAYRSPLLPMREARRKIEAAHKRFLDTQRYDAALQLADWVGRVLGKDERLLLRANTLRRWGDALVDQSQAMGNRGRKVLREGRRHLREAGIAFERVAESRFATNQYPEDLWVAAETLKRGQAYSEAIRVLERYLRNVPEHRNALALLRLGEAHLARGEDDLAIQSFEECLELHDSDASSYQARLVCAQAYKERNDFERAEELLRYNLTRTALTPASPEWRDSKFELGRLLAEMGRHDEAVATLEEAVGRYRDDPQSRGARYLIALSHRQAAREPLQRLREANTVNEREQARAEADEHLEAAYEMFQSVRNEITLSDSGEELDRATLRNCFMLGGDVLFELGRYEEARQSFSSVSTLYQNEPYMLEALVQIYHCWRRQNDKPKARGVIQQARQLLERLPQDVDFANSTTLSRPDWDRLLTQLDLF